MTEDNKEILIQFGAILKQIRIDLQLTLLEMEVRTGINEGDLSKIENGHKNFNFTTLVRISRGLDMPLTKVLKDFS